MTCLHLAISWEQVASDYNRMAARSLGCRDVQGTRPRRLAGITRGMSTRIHVGFDTAPLALSRGIEVCPTTWGAHRAVVMAR